MGNLGAGGFDSNAPENNQPLIPKGEYPAVLVKSEVVPTTNGKYLCCKMDFQILSGEFQNKHVGDRFNFRALAANPADNETLAAQIGAAKMSALGRAVNVLNPSDTSEWHGKPCLVSVGVQPAKDGYPARNCINGFKPRNGISAPSVPPATQATMEREAATAGSESTGSPW